MRIATPSRPACQSTVGLGFRETMSGGFMLGATDPGVGAQAATRLAMHAVVRIPDLEAFVADPRHLAQLGGTIDCAGLGTGIVADTGVFGLFVPSADPGLVYMVYELGFQHGGTRYYLAGKKHLRLGPPGRLWRETTTLYVSLHEGPDLGAAVVGAGVLRLGLVELLKLLGTLRATQAPGPFGAIAAIWRFFRFFATELVRRYLLHRPR